MAKYTQYDFMDRLMLILMIVLFALAVIMIIILIVAVIAGIIDRKISKKEYIIANVECISRKKSTDFMITPISTGETVSLIPRQSTSYKTVFRYEGMKLESSSENIYDVVEEGETYSAKIEIRTYPKSAKKKYDIVSICTDN